MRNRQAPQLEVLFERRKTLAVALPNFVKSDFYYYVPWLGTVEMVWLGVGGREATFEEDG